MRSVCDERNCDKPVKGYGWCQNHYRRWKNTGSPELTLPVGGKTRHGESFTKNLTTEYWTWLEMRRRCNNSNHPAYNRYGGRGITVCDRWESYEDFLEDMGRKPTKDHSIDRVNNDGNYEPGNCRWTTRREQNLNSSASRKLTVDGVTKSVTEWAEEVGIARGTIFARVRKGWSHFNAVMTPTQPPTVSKKVQR